jgi:cyclase
VTTTLSGLALLIAVTAPLGAFAQADRFAAVEIKTTAIRDGLHMLQGAGGNIVLSVGDDAAFIVDDQYGPLSAKIQAAVGKITDKPVKFILNTHWHGDHTGGNENFGKAGAVIIAQDNVRSRMSTEQFIADVKMATPASARIALPVITFAENLSVHLNGTVRLIHVANAHTDGDSLVYFQSANVLHMGDTYFNGLYPFIDLSSGGGINGYLAAIKTGLSLANDDTIIVPGHGPISNKKELQAFLDMLQGFRDVIAAQKAAGKTLAQVVKADPTKAFDKALGGAFISPEALTTTIYKSL